jgi:hypothetical protein
MRNRERIADGDSRVHGIAAVYENLPSYIGREWFLRHDHAMRGTYRFLRARGGESSKCEQAH